MADRTKVSRSRRDASVSATVDATQNEGLSRSPRAHRKRVPL